MLRGAVWAMAVAGAVWLVLWAASGAPKPAGLLALAAVLWMVSTTLALRFIARLPAGPLAWDGAVWSFTPQGGPAIAGQLQLHADGQRFLLLRLLPEGGRGQWLWATRPMQPERWADLRRAVYSRARRDAPGIPTP
ncbi:MAG: hypothetical protein QM740_12035 [Acidovorax sp.]